MLRSETALPTVTIDDRHGFPAGGRALTGKRMLHDTASMTIKDNKLKVYLDGFEKESPAIYVAPGDEGYWSNLSREQNTELISLLDTRSTRECIEATQPALADVIFSPKRVAALDLLQLKGSETAVDLGCMWGAITIALAKQAANVLGVDQTMESLKFSEARAAEAELDNVYFLRANLRQLPLPADTFDVAIVNGVLEWIPVLEPVVVDDYWKGSQVRYETGKPGEMQVDFLRNVHATLKPGGRLMLAIENRYDYKMFCGVPDPHTGTRFTTIVPRRIATLISKTAKKRDYRPWIYSFDGLKALLQSAGFSSVRLYACWPDYRFPEYIQPYGARNQSFTPTSCRQNGRVTAKRLVANRLEWLMFKLFNLQFFAPSIIAIAQE